MPEALPRENADRAVRQPIVPNNPENLITSLTDFVGKMIMTPARMVRENLVEPFRPKESYPWYHRRYV